MFKFRTEFPDFDAPGDVAAILATDPGGWADSSWHNDACPSVFHAARRLSVFVDYVDPALREFPDAGARLTVLDTYDDGGRREGDPAAELASAADFALWFRVDTLARAFVRRLETDFEAEHLADEWTASAAATEGARTEHAYRVAAVFARDAVTLYGALREARRQRSKP